MRESVARSLLTLCVVLASPIRIFAQEQGMIGASGQFSREMGNAATTNRQMADQMMQQALAQEKQALSTFPPNIGLLAKAGLNALDGMRADDQAKNLAQNTLSAVNSGEHSGSFNTANYGGMSVDQIKNLASSNSPYRGQVQSHLSSWGIKMSENGSSFQLPLGLGTVSMNIGYAEVEKGMRTAARLLGHNPDEVSAALRDTIDARQRIAGQVSVAVTPAGGAEDSSAARTLSSALPESEASHLASTATSAGGGSIENAGMMTLDFSEEKNIEQAVKQAELAQFRGEMKRQMGLSVDDVHGTRDQDIFQMIHVRYQVLRGSQVFEE